VGIFLMRGYGQFVLVFHVNFQIFFAHRVSAYVAREGTAFIKSGRRFFPKGSKYQVYRIAVFGYSLGILFLKLI